MAAELTSREDSLEEHLRAALDESEDSTVKYHLREAIQLRIAEH